MKPHYSSRFQAKQVYDQDTIPLAALRRGASAVQQKPAGNLPSAVRDMVRQGLIRLQDPQPEGFATRGFKAVNIRDLMWGKFPLLLLFNAIGLLIISFSYYLSVLRYGTLALECFFILGLLLMFVSSLIRLLSAAASRFERICLLCGLGISFYLVRFMASPLRFSEFDEFLNWRTADDMLKTGHLFTKNSMLPVGPYYPGMQIITNAISTVSGLGTFHAAVIVVSCARLLMIFALFLLYEQMTTSSRMAGMATIIYMVNPHFLYFDALFSYESLALPLGTFMFYLLVRYQPFHKRYHWTIFPACGVLLAVTITHHMTDLVFDSFLVLWAIISLFQASSHHIRTTLVSIALYSVLLSLAYIFLLPGNPVWHYLNGIFGGAFDELAHILTGTVTARPLFINPPGGQTPLWDKLFMAASVIIITFCLPFGALTLWQHYRHDALALLFAFVSLTYPVTQVFRFSNFGSDITDRSAAFLFIPIAFMLTILITHLWPTRKFSRKATLLVTCMLTIVFLGGVILNSGPGWRMLPGPYTVTADERSIEPEGILAAQWTLAQLGPNNRVGTDRINQLLMSTYGDQQLITSQQDSIEISPVFLTNLLTPEDIAILQSVKARYLVVDLRMSTAVPLQGFYFEVDESGAFHYTHPVDRTALTKFDTLTQFNRLFDSGDIVIYSVKAHVVATP